MEHQTKTIGADFFASFTKIPGRKEANQLAKICLKFKRNLETIAATK